jgi:hypothetical protein
MTDIDTDLGESPEGYRVKKTSVKVLNLGDGLSKSVAVAPIMIHAGDTVYIAVKATKTNDNYAYDFDDEGEVESVELIQTFRAQSATFVEFEAVSQAIAMMEARIAKSKVAPGQEEILRTCGACGWREGDVEEFCLNGSPLHDFPVGRSDVEEPEGDADPEGRPLSGDQMAEKGLDK